MKRINFRLLYFLICILSTFLSCTKEVEITIPQKETKLVLNSLFSLDKPLEVHLSRSTNFLDYKIIPVEDATVVLYSENKAIDTLNYTDTCFYISQFTPEINKRYTIKVKDTELANITTTDYIPYKPVIISGERIENLYTDEVGNYNSRLKLNFRDDPHVKNFYLIGLFYRDNYTSYMRKPGTNETIQDTANGWCWLRSEAPVIQSKNEQIQSWGKSIIFNDDLINGQNHSLIIDYTRGFSVGRKMIEDYTMYVHFYSISENYYNYQRKLNMRSNSGSEFLNNTGEVVRMYSNIENGYGIFAGYNYVVDTILSK